MRQALPEDAEAIAELEMELFPDNCLNEYTIRNELKFSRCWVVDYDNKLVAYIIARVDGDLVDILRVAVVAGKRGGGIGYRLVTKALTLAPRAVLMVRKDNQDAISLYRSLGFQVAGELHKSWMMVTSYDS